MKIQMSLKERTRVIHYVLAVGASTGRLRR
ncbi:MAG: hypothetical protein KatS3mg109_1989 [Pirellulaceae bacterium]|nr:MAG: hypothetical protein KatS3mg109_1989 [Pirellulaceae bacterium]